MFDRPPATPLHQQWHVAYILQGGVYIDGDYYPKDSALRSQGDGPLQAASDWKEFDYFGDV